MPSKKGRLSDDDKLLQRTGRDVSTTASALFYGHAIIVSALPLCKINNAWNYITVSLLVSLLCENWVQHVAKRMVGN